MGYPRGACGHEGGGGLLFFNSLLMSVTDTYIKFRYTDLTGNESYVRNSKIANYFFAFISLFYILLQLFKINLE